ncbi:MAG: O-antigen ligase family protein, partial [Ilumatobacteraceae bacterium]
MTEIVFIILIVLITVFFSILRLRWGLYAVAMALPTYVLRTHIGPLPTTALELAIVALCVVVAFRLLTRAELRASLSYIWTGNGLRWPVLAFVAASFIGVVVSPNLRESFGAWRAWVLEPAVVAAIALMTVRSLEHAKNLVLSLVVSGGALSFYGLAEYFISPDHLGDGRLNSVFVPANYHAMFIVPIILLVLPLLREWRGTWRGGVATVSVLVMTLSLYFTYSFGGYLALGAGLLIMVFAQARPKQRIGALIVVVLLGLAVVATQLQTFKLWNVFNVSGRSSTSVRVQIWHSAAVMIQEHPVFGIGYANFESVYRQVVPRLYWPPLEWLVTQPHNLYLALWTEIGIFGLLTFLWLIIAAFRVLRRT